MFGVATSLGLGVLQVNAGLEHIFGLPSTVSVQLVLIAAITGLATISVVLGLDVGIRRLSELNIVLAVTILCFVLVAGPTLFLLRALMQNLGAYLSDVVRLTFRTYAYEPNEWLGSWTLFYWGWWIAWSPFVGMFIARISRGRTIREFVMGVLLVPVLFTFLWMTVFGDTALWMERSGIAPIAQVVTDNMPVALFVLLEALPLSTITSLIATLLIVTFFVTSADSGALVISIMLRADRRSRPSGSGCSGLLRLVSSPPFFSSPEGSIPCRRPPSPVPCRSRSSWSCCAMDCCGRSRANVYTRVNA